MANLEKHPKSHGLEWIDAEENLVPTRARSSRVLGHYIKNKPQKAVGAKAPPLPAKEELSPESGFREAAVLVPPAEGKKSPLSSFEHQRRMTRLRSLRSPYAAKPGRAAPTTTTGHR